ncbi:hypothetical protein H8J78_14170, partial [Clostridium perfringens]|nr:hypothetical protein [Clostridium perfringens]
MLHYQNKVAKWTTLFYVAYQQFNLTEPNEKERGKAMGLSASAVAMGVMVGPALGG